MAGIFGNFINLNGDVEWSDWEKTLEFWCFLELLEEQDTENYGSDETVGRY